MKGLAVPNGMTGFAANDAELIFCVVVKDVTMEFSAIAPLMTYLFTVVANYHAGPNTICGCMTSTSTVVTVPRCGHRSCVVKLSDVEGERGGWETVDVDWFVTGSLMGFEWGR